MRTRMGWLADATVPVRAKGETLVRSVGRNWIPFCVGIAYAVMAITRFKLHMVGLDAAIFDQAIRNYSTLKAPDVMIKSVEPFNILGDHFSPAMALYAPIFAVAPSVLTLLIAQAALFAFAVGVVQHTALQVGLGRRLSAALAVAYSCSAGLMESVNFDFHEVSLTVPVLALGLSFLLRDRLVPGLSLLLCTLLIREDNAIIIFGAGLVYLCMRRWRLGLALMVAGTAAFALITLVIIPYFSYSGTYTYYSTSNAGAGNGIGGYLGSLGGTISKSMAPSVGMLTILVLLMSFLMLPLRSKWILPAVALMGLRLASPNPAYWILAFHYNSVVSTILAFAAIAALVPILHKERSINNRQLSLRSISGGLCLVAVASFLCAGGVSYLQPSTYSCERCGAMDEILAHIPAGQTVAADPESIGSLVDRYQTYAAAPQLLDSVANPMNPEWVLLNLRTGTFDSSSGWVPILRDRLIASGRYALAMQRQDYILLQRL